MAKRRLEIDVIVDDTQSSRGLGRVGRNVDTLESRLRRAGATGTRVLGGAIAAGAVAAGYEIKRSVEQAREANKVGAQTGAVIRSTGGAAKVSARDVADLAGAISLKAGLDDEAIQTGANLLLTFTNIRNEVGRGNDVFNQSTRTIVDMSAALDQDLKSSAIQVGKALNDPIKGLTALQRVGVSFSEQKSEQIKQWVEEGDTLRAQKAILRELNKEFGGSAAAQADSFDKLKVGAENAEEAIGQIFLPILSDAADEITREFLPRIEEAGGVLSRVFDNPNLTLDEKLARAGGVIKREFGDIPPAIAGAIEDAVPIVASHFGQMGVAGARGMVEGFANADVWGKLAIGGFLLAKMGGLGAFSKLGTRSGTRFASAFLLAVLGTELAKEIKNIVEGHELGQTDREAVSADFTERFDLDPGQIKFQGKDRLRVPTEIGDLIFDARTEKVVKARGQRLQKFVGQEVNLMITGLNSELSRLHSGQGAIGGGGDDPWGLALSMSKSWRKAGGVTREGLADISRELDRLPPDAARASGQLMLQIVRQMRQKGQMPKGEAEKIRAAVVNKLDTMARQGGRKGQLLSQNVGGSFGGMSTTAAEALQNMGGNLEGVLQQLGVADIPQFQIQFFASKGLGGRGQGWVNSMPELEGFGEARGALKTVPGAGLQDSVPVSVNGALSAVVAPGETLATINRHQYPLLDYAVTAALPVSGLPDFFETYNRPHYMARGGFPEIGVAGRGPLAKAANRTTHRAYLQMRKYLREHMGPGRVIQNIDRMDALRQPYLWGGGHGATASVNGPWDCSGGVTEALDGGGIPTSPMVSGEFMNWGKPGKGPVTVLANPGHMYMVVQTPRGWRAAGTSEENPGGGFGWIDGYTFRGGFAVRHVDAGGAAKLMRRGGGGRGKGQDRRKGFAQGGMVVKGTTTWFNGGATAGGSNTSQPGLALNLNAGSDSGWDNDTTRGWMEASQEGHPVFAQVSVGGKSADLPITDLGPAGWTGHSIDVTEGGVAKLGFTTSNFPSGTVGVAKILGEGGKTEPPASKQQKGTLGRLRRRASRLAGEIRQLEREYDKHGGTKRGRRALKRALKLARTAARKVKAGSREEADKLIDKARDAIGDSRDALEQAGENVFTPGLKAGSPPPLGAGVYDAGQEFSTSNLPGLDALPKSVQSQLASPGLSATGKYGVLETALSDAGLTDTRADDAAALNAMLGMSRQRRKRLKGKLDELNARLKKGGLTKAQRATLVTQRDSVLSALGEVSGNIGSIREQIGGLNEETEADDSLKEAIEANTQAMQDHTAALQENAKQIAEQIAFAQSATATGSGVAWKALSDILSGQLGGTAQMGAATAGNGSIGTLGRF